MLYKTRSRRARSRSRRRRPAVTIEVRAQVAVSRSRSRSRWGRSVGLCGSCSRRTAARAAATRRSTRTDILQSGQPQLCCNLQHTTIRCQPLVRQLAGTASGCDRSGARTVHTSGHSVDFWRTRRAHVAAPGGVRHTGGNGCSLLVDRGNSGVRRGAFVRSMATDGSTATTAWFCCRRYTARRPHILWCSYWLVGWLCSARICSAARALASPTLPTR